VLIERDSFLAALSALADEALNGAGGRLAFLGGEAGVGKSALAAVFADATAEQMSVRRGGCDNVATPAALGPLFDAVPELSDLIENEAGVHQLRLFRRLRTVLSAEPTLLLLEDVHWADEATLEMLRYLGRRLDGLPLMVLATFRDDDVSASHPLTMIVGDLATSPGVTRMSLPPLTVGGVQQLIDRVGSALDPQRVHSKTGGNPFYVTELLATHDRELPATVRDAVLARASRLSAPAWQVLAAAAVLGQRADVRLLASVSGEPVEAVDECVQRGILVDDAGGLGIRHELARLAIEQTLAPAARTELHASALRALRSVRADDGRLAHHAEGCGDQMAVLEYAPRAAARAARLGAHRQAAEHYRLALRFEDRSDENRASLFTALSYECYLIDELTDAYEAQRAAMLLFTRAGDALAVGTAQRWLSRLSWFHGRTAEGKRHAADAVATLEPLGDGHELAMAYSNQAQLCMVADDVEGATSWGERAIELARRIGDREAEIHALNNLGMATASASDSFEGLHRLAQSLDMALADDAHEHAARAYTNLGTVQVRKRHFADADRYLRTGIAYCEDRDLDAWALYMNSWLAHSLAEQGHYADADECIRAVLSHPRLSPITRIIVHAVAGQLAARRGEDSNVHLEDAFALAVQTGEAQRLVHASSARAEAAWIDGRTGDIEAEIDYAWVVVAAHPERWYLGELCWWLARAGVPRTPPVPLPQPFALMVDHAWEEAAQQWRQLGCPLWEAYALSAAPDLGSARRALEIVDALGAVAVRQALLRERYLQGLPVPRGPRPPSQANPLQLTAREMDVLHLLAEGLSNAEVAGRLFLSEKTVGHHVSAVLRKLGQPTRSRAVAAAIRKGIVRPT
jgi:DNA-binding CsgD family transcriptional regulator/tetratricopeptide (TPR) repeat protein